MKLRAWLLGVLLLAVFGYAVAEFTVGPGGLYIADGTPGNTDNKLYSVAGTLYWDGAAVEGGGGGGGTFDCTGEDSKWKIPATNTQTAIVNALAAAPVGGPVYLPPGTYTLTSGITLSQQGQILSGAGVERTILYVANGFTDTGALKVTGHQIVIRDLTIRFYQPETFTYRSQLNGYTNGSAAIYNNAKVRLQCYNLDLDMVYNGIQLLNNCGQSGASNVRITHFNKGIELTNALDITRFSNINFDDSSLSGAKLALYKDSGTYGFYFGRTDDVMIENSRFSCGTGIYLYNGIDDGEHGVTPVGSMRSCYFENSRGINMTSGYLSIDGCRFDLTSYAFPGITQSGGSTLLVSGCTFNNTYSGAVSADLGTSTSTSITGCYFYGSKNQDELYMHSTGNYAVNGCMFERASGASYTVGAIIQGGTAKVTFVGNRFTPVFSAPYSSKGLTFGTVNIGHVVCGNAFNSWSHDSASGVNDKEGHNN